MTIHTAVASDPEFRVHKAIADLRRLLVIGQPQAFSRAAGRESRFAEGLLCCPGPHFKAESCIVIQAPRGAEIDRETRAFSVSLPALRAAWSP